MATASSSASPDPTGPWTDKLTGILAEHYDLETWTPGTEAEAQDAITAVAAYCRDYCPVRLQCAEEACRLFRLEGRADAMIRHTPAETVGVLGQSVIGGV
jgi:hypothetical protein